MDEDRHINHLGLLRLHQPITVHDFDTFAFNEIKNLFRRIPIHEVAIIDDSR
jgi:hypothetical protein